MSDWPWPRPPRALPDPAAEVHLWSIAIGPEVRPGERHLALLDEGERARAARFRVEHARRGYVISHAATRDILGRYLTTDPRSLRFEEGARGKPHLATMNGSPPLHFNLSHSADTALLAVTGIAPLGVDVERVREMPDFEDIAERFFARGEIEALGRAASAEYAATWFRCWVRKEAYIKATGDGLHCPLDRFEVSLPPDEPPRIRAIAEGDAARWTLVDLVPREGTVGALAIDAPCTTVRRWHWAGAEA